MNTKTAQDKILEEFLRASSIYKPFSTYHEGYAIIKEEFDELWEEIKHSHYDRGDRNEEEDTKIQTEAVQVGAMILRFLIDLTKDGDENMEKQREKLDKLLEEIDEETRVANEKGFYRCDKCQRWIDTNKEGFVVVPKERMHTYFKKDEEKYRYHLVCYIVSLISNLAH
jgi:hypothetical protein